MDEVEKMDETSGSLVKHVIFPQCSARLSAVTVWYVIEKLQSIHFLQPSTINSAF